MMPLPAQAEVALVTLVARAAGFDSSGMLFFKEIFSFKRYKTLLRPLGPVFSSDTGALGGARGMLVSLAVLFGFPFIEFSLLTKRLVAARTRLTRLSQIAAPPWRVTGCSETGPLSAP